MSFAIQSTIKAQVFVSTETTIQEKAMVLRVTKGAPLRFRSFISTPHIVFITKEEVILIQHHSALLNFPFQL